MSRNIYFTFLITCIMVTAATAQVPKFRFSKYDTTGVSTTSNDFSDVNYGIKMQSIYYPIDFPLLPAGTIKSVYVRIGRNGTGTTSVTYPALIAKLGYTADSFFRYNGPSGFDTFKTGLTTVYGPANFTVTGTDSIGKWVKIPLTTPFYYNKEQKFVFELSTAKKSNSAGFDVMTSNRAPFYSPHRNRNMVGHRDSLRQPNDNANITIMDLGFDIQPNSVSESPKVFSSYAVFPNPCADGKFNVSVELVKAINRANITILNVAGQEILHREYQVAGKHLLAELALENAASGDLFNTDRCKW